MRKEIEMTQYTQKRKKTAHRSPTKTKPAGKYDSRLKRIAEEQVIHDIQFEMETSSTFKHFEETISALYGVPGIGKSKFAELLGLILQKKYSLKTSATYFLQCEPINHPWQIRKTRLVNWPTFRRFIDNAEQDPEFVKTIKMWVIDTIDGIIPKGISSICSDFGVADLKDATVRVGIDGWHAKAWQELRDELLYQILRLASLGPGVLILSHERYRKATVNRIIIEKPSMDVSNSIYNAVGDACSIILRMRPVDEGRKSKSAPRCLSFLPSEYEDVKDNLQMFLPKYPDGTIRFTTEKEAVNKILACYTGGKEVQPTLPRRRRKKKARR